jgi:hypothetical protein
VDTPPINQSIRLLSLKATLDPKSALRLVKTGETASNSKDIASNNYNNNIIIINISHNKNKGGKI